MSVRDRLLAASGSDGNGCWLWSGAFDGKGYASIKVNGRQVGAHRAAYEEFRGPIPEGLTLDHLCRHPHCINPYHLEPVSMRENTLRGVGPTATGARKTHCVHGHELTPENTYVGGSPFGRRCRTCRREQDRARRAR